MQKSLYTAVSGVKVHQTYLDVTGNNIANVNTVGYKRDVIQFADIISQTIKNDAAPVTPPGGIDPAQTGLGVRIASIDTCFMQGPLQNSDISADMAIVGDGFFVVNSRGSQLYTRAGNFALDAYGNLVMQGSGYLVQGFKFNGTSQEDSLSDITIPVSDSLPERATAIAAFKCNLDSSAAARITMNYGYDNEGSLDVTIDPYTRDVARPFQYADASDVYASASSVSNPAAIDTFGKDMLASSDWKDSFAVYDDAGQEHILNVVFRKALNKPADPEANPPTSAESEWDWYAYYADGDGNPVPAYGQGAGTMVFDEDGLLKRTYTFDPASEWSVVEKNIAAGSDGKPTGLVSANFGAAGTPIVLDFLGSDYAAAEGLTFSGLLDGITSYDYSSTTKMKGQDGYPQGILENWSVSDQGVITGQYSNGQLKPISQIAIARFMNPQGLKAVGTTCFDETDSSGPVRIVKASEGGAGTIKGLTTEMSNVDLSEEFVNLIRSQRGLQANTRAVTTSDQMLENLINLKR
ncbi:MAG: flagellar hook protein FlgE [Synergistaceae bacterium]|jgi:flagellar hook protein FlgE|nr:flagellar hook protein FlgE [Synergistaceae bacterium]